MTLAVVLFLPKTHSSLRHERPYGDPDTEQLCCVTPRPSICKSSRLQTGAVRMARQLQRLVCGAALLAEPLRDPVIRVLELERACCRRWCMPCKHARF